MVEGFLFSIHDIVLLPLFSCLSRDVVWVDRKVSSLRYPDSSRIITNYASSVLTKELEGFMTKIGLISIVNFVEENLNLGIRSGIEPRIPNLF